LNSFVKLLCSFGMMPSRWMLSFKFISSGKVRQSQWSFHPNRLLNFLGPI
jgi:hypothetical protein